VCWNLSVLFYCGEKNSCGGCWEMDGFVFLRFVEGVLEE